MQNDTNIPIEFQSDVEEGEHDFYRQIDEHIRKLAKGHQDIIGAAARLERPAQGRETTPLFEASVVVYMRPDNVAAMEKDQDPNAAIQGALDALERQVREKRDQLRGY